MILVDSKKKGTLHAARISHSNDRLQQNIKNWAEITFIFQHLLLDPESKVLELVRYHLCTLLNKKFPFYL